MRHLKFVIVILLFAIIPSLLMHYGTKLFLNQQRDVRYEETFKQLNSQLRNLLFRVNSQKDKLESLQKIKKDLRSVDIFSPEAIENFRNEISQKHPDIFQVFIATRISDGDDKPPTDAYYSAKLLKKRFLMKKLAVRLLDGFHGKKLSKKIRGMIKEQLFGDSKGIIDQLAENQPWDMLSPAKYDDKYSSFFHTIQVRTQGSKILLMLFIDDEKLQEFYNLEKVITLLEQSQTNSKIRFFSGSDRKVIAKKISESDPSVAPMISGKFTSLFNTTGETNLYAFQDLLKGDGGRTLLVASQKRTESFPEYFLIKQRMLMITLSYLLLFTIIYFLVHYQIINVFISVRTQLVFLFLLAVFFPLVSLFYLGIQYMDSQKDVLIQNKYDAMAQNISGLDEQMVQSIEEFREIALDINNKEATSTFKAFNAAVKERDWKSMDTSRVKKYFAPLTHRLNKRKNELNIEDWFMYDDQGHLLYMKDNGKPHITEEKFLNRMARMSANFHNTGRLNPPSVKGDLGSEEDIIDAFIGAYSSEVFNALITNPNKIHKIKIFKFDWVLMMRPIRDAATNKVVAIFIVTFQLDDFRQNLITQVVTNKEKQKAEQIKYCAIGINKNTFKNVEEPTDLSMVEKDFLTRVKSMKVSMKEIIKINGVEFLAYGTPMKEIEEYTMAGFYPLSEIERVVQNTYKLFVLIFFLSLLVALFIAVVISKKFITPVKSLQHGVKAITEGNLTWRMQIESNDELGELSTTFNKMVSGLQEKERMSRYVSESVLSEVKKDSSDDRLGEERKATILFSDIRGFTTLSESHPPEEIIRMLNDYFDVMTRVIQENGGIIDKFIGDAIMAVFYPDLTSGGRSDESRCVIAALRMREELAKFNKKRRAAGLFEIENGIGINTGDVIQGNIGSREYRIDLTVIGDNVNIAARLESLSKEGKHSHIILSEKTYQGVRDLVEVENFGDRTVKGKTTSVALFEVVGLRRMEDYLSWITDQDESRRVQGIRLLGVIGNQLAIPHILACLEDNSPQVRGEVARILGNLVGKDPTTAKQLLTYLPKEAEEHVRASLVVAIGVLGDDSVLAQLEPWLSDESSRVRANAIEAMGQASDSTLLVRILGNYLKDQNNRIRANAGVMLWNLGKTVGLETLLEMTSERSALMRASGAWGIGEIATRENLSRFRINSKEKEDGLKEEFFVRLEKALDVMHGLLEDADLMVVRNAIKGIAKMGNRQSAHVLIRKYQQVDDDEIRMILLSALDEIGSFNIVRQLKEEMNR